MDGEVKVAAKEIGKHARALLDEGWVQEQYAHYGERKSYCLIGAVNAAVGCYGEMESDKDPREGEYGWEQTAARRLLLETIAGCINSLRVGSHYSSGDIEAFNDEEQTTKEEVLTVMDCALEKTA